MLAGGGNGGPNCKENKIWLSDITGTFYFAATNVSFNVSRQNRNFLFPAK
jgi:hypothetical protein